MTVLSFSNTKMLTHWILLKEQDSALFFFSCVFRCLLSAPKAWLRHTIFVKNVCCTFCFVSTLNRSSGKSSGRIEKGRLVLVSLSLTDTTGLWPCTLFFPPKFQGGENLFPVFPLFFQSCRTLLFHKHFLSWAFSLKAAEKMFLRVELMSLVLHDSDWVFEISRVLRSILMLWYFVCSVSQ